MLSLLRRLGRGLRLSNTGYSNYRHAPVRMPGGRYHQDPAVYSQRYDSRSYARFKDYPQCEQFCGRADCANWRCQAERRHRARVARESTQRSPTREPQQRPRQGGRENTRRHYTGNPGNNARHYTGNPGNNAKVNGGVPWYEQREHRAPRDSPRKGPNSNPQEQTSGLGFPPLPAPVLNVPTPAAVRIPPPPPAPVPNVPTPAVVRIPPPPPAPCRIVTPPPPSPSPPPPAQVQQPGPNQVRNPVRVPANPKSKSSGAAPVQVQQPGPNQVRNPVRVPANPQSKSSGAAPVQVQRPGPNQVRNPVRDPANHKSQSSGAAPALVKPPGPANSQHPSPRPNSPPRSASSPPVASRQPPGAGPAPLPPPGSTSQTPADKPANSPSPRLEPAAVRSPSARSSATSVQPPRSAPTRSPTRSHTGAQTGPNNPTRSAPTRSATRSHTGAQTEPNNPTRSPNPPPRVPTPASTLHTQHKPAQTGSDAFAASDAPVSPLASAFPHTGHSSLSDVSALPTPRAPSATRAPDAKHSLGLSTPRSEHRQSHLGLVQGPSQSRLSIEGNPTDRTPSRIQGLDRYEGVPATVQTMQTRKGTPHPRREIAIHAPSGRSVSVDNSSKSKQEIRDPPGISNDPLPVTGVQKPPPSTSVAPRLRGHSSAQPSLAPSRHAQPRAPFSSVASLTHEEDLIDLGSKADLEAEGFVEAFATERLLPTASNDTRVTVRYTLSGYTGDTAGSSELNSDYYYHHYRNSLEEPSGYKWRMLRPEEAVFTGDGVNDLPALIKQHLTASKVECVLIDWTIAGQARGGVPRLMEPSAIRIFRRGDKIRSHIWPKQTQNAKGSAPAGKIVLNKAQETNPYRRNLLETNPYRRNLLETNPYRRNQPETNPYRRNHQAETNPYRRNKRFPEVPGGQ